MKKITLFLFMFFITLKGFSQFGCGSGVVITNGYTSGSLTTPGNSGPENWVTSATPLAGTNASYWDDDVYLFQYTAGATTESISITIESVNSWNGAGIFTTCSGTSLSGALATQGTTGANSTKTLEATLVANQTVYIAVGQWGTPDALNFSVTNFTATPVVTPPNCTTLAVPVDGATSVSSTIISWLAATGSPTGYKVFVGTTAGGTNIVNGLTTTSLNYSLPALLLSTIYYVKIVPFNANGDAATCTESSFTSCGPIGNTWSENFDAVIIPNLPSCWSGAFAGAAPGAQVITGNVASSTPNSLRMRSDASASTASVIAVSPYTPNLNSGTHRLVFQALTNNTADDLVIGTLSNPSDATTFTPLLNVDINTTFAQYIVSFAGYAGTDKYIGLKRLCINTFNSVYVDDISWEVIPAVAPICATGITATPDAACGNFNTAIGWTAAPNADGYRLTIGTTAGGTNILNNVSIGNLTSYNTSGNSATTYFYKLVPFNAIGDAIGCAEQSYTTFATGCYCPSVPISNDNDGITNVQLATTDFPTTDVTYFDHTATAVSFQQSINANVQVTFATGYTYNTYIWIDFNNNFTFEPSELVKSVIATVSTNPNTLDASFVMPLTAALGTHRMRIVTADDVQPTPNPCYSGAYGVTLDFNVTITTAPACVAPSGLTSSAVTASTATVSWGAVTPTPAIGYEYVVSTSNVTPSVAGTQTTAITANITSGLFGQTTYYLFVRSDCGSGFSAWSPSISFTTLCAPITAPATETFDTFLPICWSKGQDGDLTTGPIAFLNDFSGWTADGFANEASGLGAIDVNVYQLSTLNDWIISAQFAIPATGYKLQFDAAATEYATANGTPINPWEADDKVEVLVSTTGTTNWTVLNTFDNTNQPTETGTNYNYNLDAYSGQNVRFAFRATEGAANGPADIEFSIDNLNVSNVLKTESFDLVGFSAYPNPVKDVLNLSYTKDISNVSVLNLLGQEVISKSVNAPQTKVDTSNLSNGTYLVKVTVDGLVKTMKVLKQ